MIIISLSFIFSILLTSGGHVKIIDFSRAKIGLVLGKWTETTHTSHLLLYDI